MIPLMELRGSYTGFPICLMCVLILMGQQNVTILSIRRKRGRAHSAAALVLLAAGFLLLSVLLDAVFVPFRKSPNETRPALVEALLAAPWLWTVGMELALAALLCLQAWDVARWGREHLSRDSVKEAVDLLPAGICVAEPDGTPALVNLKMHEFCRAVTGEWLMDANAFWQTVCEAGEDQGGQRIVACPGGQTLLFARSDVTVEESAYRRILGMDVTEQYRVTSELREKNERLKDIQRRFKALGEQTSAMVFEQETLSARVAVHDELGQVLLLGRYYLEHPESANADMVWHMMQQTNTVFLRDAEETGDEDACAYALRMAEEIGVRVDIEGEMPQGGERRELLGQAIRECAVNAAKHGNADRMTLTLRRDEEGLMADIRNNGSAPLAPVRESGGLLSLRKTVEAAGGEMRVLSGPDFCVTLTLP